MRWQELMQQQDAFAAAIRKENGLTFAADPYIKGFRNRLDPDIIHLYFDDGNSGGSVWMHLICGQNAAMLIDTGYGIGNLRAAIQTLTDKPVLVFNTHWHGDHTGGNGQFADVYMQEYDIPYWQNSLQQKESRMFPAVLPFAQRDVIPFGNTVVHPVQDGDTFDLGDRTVTVLHTPGHSAGNCMLLDTKTHILFSGDAILSTPTLIIDGFPQGTHAELLTVAAFGEALHKHADKLAAVQWLCPSHGRLMLKAGYIQAMQHCIQAIREAPLDYECYDYIPDQPGKIRCVDDAMIVYTLNRVEP